MPLLFTSSEASAFFKSCLNSKLLALIYILHSYQLVSIQFTNDIPCIPTLKQCKESKIYSFSAFWFHIYIWLLSGFYIKHLFPLLLVYIKWSPALFVCNSDILAFFTKIELVEKEYVREQKAAQEEYEVRAASQLWGCFILFLCDYFVILFIFIPFTNIFCTALWSFTTRTLPYIIHTTYLNYSM